MTKFFYSLSTLAFICSCNTQAVENIINVKTPDNKEILEKIVDTLKNPKEAPSPTPTPTALSLQAVWKGSYIVKVPHEVTIKTILALNPDDSFSLEGGSELGDFKTTGTYQVNESDNAITFKTAPDSITSPCDSIDGEYAYVLTQRLNFSPRKLPVIEGCSNTGKALLEPSYSQ